MNSKGQGGTELLIIIGVGLVIVITVMVMNQDLLSTGQKTVRKDKVQSMMDRLANSGIQMYRQGTGSRVKVPITVPDQIVDINISNKSMIVTFVTNDTYLYNFGFPVSGTIPTKSGNYIITVHSYDDAVHFFASDTTAPGTISSLSSPNQGTTWIYWTWSAPSDGDFHKVTLFLDSVEHATTTNTFFNVTGLLSNTSYTLDVQAHDQSGNVNGTLISDTDSTIVATEFTTQVQALHPQLCSGEDNSNESGQFTGSCDGIYPQACGHNLDLLTCNDGKSETHLAQRINTTYYYGGIEYSTWNTTVINCFSISSVDLCYEWWHDASLQNCFIKVDADGGDNYSTVTTTCPGTSPGGTTCTNVTSLETWQCNNFFGSSGTRAKVQSEAQRSGGKGTTIISWDALFYNVTYLEI